MKQANRAARLVNQFVDIETAKKAITLAKAGRMYAADAMLQTFGVEYYVSPSGVAYAYCNTGDPYTPTIMRSLSSGLVYVQAWGDLEERRR